MIKKLILLFVFGPIFTANAVENSAMVPDYYCPSIKKLIKNPNPAISTWSAQTKAGAWKSYDLSFATNVTEFLGAQWVGEEVGQITCLYKSEQRFTMRGKPVTQPTIPILMVYNTLSFEPKGNGWDHKKKNGHSVQGVMECHSSNRQDCPYKPHMERKVGNVLEQAESLKQENVSSAPSN